MFKKIPLHWQILIALVLGTLMGIFFSVNQNEIIIKTADNKTISIENWDSFSLLSNSNDTISTFGSKDQLPIIKTATKFIKENKIINISYSESANVYNIDNIISLAKPITIATQIKPIGTIFIRLLGFIAVPLVLSSLIVGAASLGDFKKLGRIGGKTFLIYIVTTALAITIGVTLANVLKPGAYVPPETKERLLSAYQADGATVAVENVNVDVIDFIVNIIPKNPFDAIASGNMLQIVFFAVILGLMLTYVEKNKATQVVNFFDGISDAMVKLVDLIMLIAPFGVFALMASTIADFGFDILSTLLWYSLVVILGLLIQTIIVYGSIIKFLAKFPLLKFFKGIRNAQAIGFSTSSSAATLPVTYECVEENLGVKKEISGFVLPLGATINMDGTALYQGVATIFIAQVYGFDLQLSEQLTIIFTAVLASIGTAPVPGVGLIMLVMILQSVNLPAEGIALILGVDRILDMMRTVTNVTGDAAVTVAIAAGEGKIAT